MINCIGFVYFAIAISFLHIISYLKHLSVIYKRNYGSFSYILFTAAQNNWITLGRLYDTYVQNLRWRRCYGVNSITVVASYFSCLVYLFFDALCHVFGQTCNLYNGWIPKTNIEWMQRRVVPKKINEWRENMVTGWWRLFQNLMFELL